VKPDGTIDVAAGKHLDGQAEFQGGHTDPSWADPTHHGYQASMGGLPACTGCHVGFGTAGGATGSSCNECHSGGTTAWQTNCTFCHGTAGRTGAMSGADARLAAAPPVGTQGETATATVAVGAHQAHVNPAASGAVKGPLACTSCHPSPLPADVTHVNGQPTPIQFGGLAVQGGATPSYVRGESPTCSSTYCHGSFRFGGVTGNVVPPPAWNAAGRLGCTGCHGMPPAGHPALTGTVNAATCSSCHPATVGPDGTIDVAAGKHLNGQAEIQGGHTDPAWADPTHHGYQASATGVQTCTGCHVGFGAVAGIAGSSCNDCHSGGTSAWQSNCTFCHGTAGRTGIVTGTDARLAAAPPVGSQGQTTRSQAAVGAHQAHVNPPATTWMARPVACTVCHPSPLPADAAHVDGQPAPVEFSGLATNWGLTPTYARGANPTCASTYCHGGGLVGGTNTTPSWTGGSMTCTSCHGIPPGTGEHGNHPGGNDCNLCHPGVNAAGTALTSRTRHADGIVDVTHGDGTWSCDTCH
jgi:predicted CxxxxCH...CXXCH cytochrome family protein